MVRGNPGDALEDLRLSTGGHVWVTADGSGGA
jgi:hypothetical protein